MGFETTCCSQQGDSRALSITLSPFPAGDSSRVLMVAQVTTEGKQWEEQLLQAEKIRAVSQLASGVSHDINNDLAVILGYSEYLLSRANDLDISLRQALGAIQQQAQSCAETVHRIQLFSLSPPRSKFTDCCVNDVVRQVVEVTESKWHIGPRETSRNIGIDMDLRSTPQVLGHFASLIEVVSSLINNAVAALPDGGTVSFRTVCEDEVVILEIADDGVGIDPSHMKRISEPFFTTKGPSSSGLGLAIAYNLVNQMNGTLSVESGQGAGTTLRVRFPATPALPAAPESPDGAIGAKQRLDVMVVDDEPLVAEMLKTFLESLSHRASVFLDGV